MTIRMDAVTSAASSRFDLSDPSPAPHLPGTGASRATRLVELYARLVYPPLTVLIVDALTRIFRNRGATEEEFSHYLGLPGHVVQSAVDRLPGSVVVRIAVDDSDESGLLGDSAEDGVSGKSSTGGKGIGKLRHFINYRTALPFVVAHFRSFMIPLCHVSPLPFPRTLSGSGGGAGGAVPMGYSVSAKLLQGNDDRGLFCAGCSTWQCEADLRPHTTRCGVCNSDVLLGALKTAQAAWTATLAAASGSDTRVSATPRGLLTAHGSCGAVAMDGTPVAKLLREDAYVLQQGLVMHFLTSSRFCFVDKDAVVSDPDGVMTAEEFAARAAQRSSLAERFRARHRNGTHLRVRFMAQLDAERDQLHRNRVRLRRRGHLPPWLLASAPGVAAKTQRAESQLDRLTVGATSNVSKRRRIEDNSRDPALESLQEVRALANVVARKCALGSAGVVNGEVRQSEDEFIPVFLRNAR